MTYRYIALIRAINVGGHRKIKMADLRDMCSATGFENVTTYIQSGNVIFDSKEADPETVSRILETEIERTFGFDVPVITRTVENLELLAEKNPFRGQNRDPYMLYVTFFREKPSSEAQQTLIARSTEVEQFQFINGELFSLIHKKTDQKVNFSSDFVEKLAGIPGTTRNWNSTNKILDLARIEP